MSCGVDATRVIGVRGIVLDECLAGRQVQFVGDFLGQASGIT